MENGKQYTADTLIGTVYYTIAQSFMQHLVRLSFMVIHGVPTPWDADSEIFFNHIQILIQTSHTQRRRKTRQGKGKRRKK
jgi:hypothetical protein